MILEVLYQYSTGTWGGRKSPELATDGRVGRGRPSTGIGAATPLRQGDYPLD